MNITERAIVFIKDLFHVYLEERDFEKFRFMLSDDISWIGTGAHEICNNYAEADKLLKAEEHSWDGNFKILDQWYLAEPINDEFCVVYGELKIEENGRETFLLEMHSRVSLVCRLFAGELKLVHAHFSVPNAGQKEEEFVHKSLVQDYNTMLEAKLEERTEMLKGKMQELEVLMSNIQGGVEIRNLDEGYTIAYTNSGFYNLTGYTKKEIAQHFDNWHSKLVAPEDLLTTEASIIAQLEHGNSFTLEYRIRRKDGELIWVLDKGRIVETENGQKQAHCVLTDITAQKKLQEELLQKNEELSVSEMRYQIAAKHAGFIIFDYMIECKQISHPKSVADQYGIPCVVSGAAESPIWKRIVHPSSMKDFLAAYRGIDEGKSTVKATILLTDISGKESINEIFLTNIFDKAGKPVRAIGLMSDVTEASKLEREKQYQKAMVYNKMQTYEANVTQNRVTSIDLKWVETLGIPQYQTFTEMVEYMCSNVVDSNNRESFREFFSGESIAAALNSGRTQQVIQYRRREKSGRYDWVQSTMSIICDEITRDIKIRCYMNIITEQKENEQRIAEEQRFYELMLTKSPLVYEANITKDLFVRGYEKWGILFGIQINNSYTDMIESFCEKAVHPNDRSAFKKTFLRENVLNTYYAGKKESYCEYRRQNENGDMVWFSCTMHMMEDVNSSDVIGFSYVLNINAEKLKEQELVYKAEHDMLTGLYNKSVTEQLIEQCLQEDESKTMRHVFFMFDIDNFKQINDNLGHAFGDAVLSQAAKKIKELFREDDIIGRVGGDEFAVLMKNVSSINRITTKAKQLCDGMREAYTKDGKEYRISVSIGVAICGRHGNTYKELYRHADMALYASKKSGRDQYKIYENNMSATNSIIKNIDVNDMIEARSFEKNISEYVFRILYESTNKVSCINLVLELIGKQYNVDRAYIFEDSQDGLCTNNTFEWCNNGIEPQKEHLQNVVYTSLGNYKSRFNEQGIFYMADIRVMPRYLKHILEPQGVKSLLHFAIIKGDKIIGFVGFDQCSRGKVPSKAEITELRSISNILGVFLVEMRVSTLVEATKNTALSIVDGLDSYAYVIDRDTHELLFVNQSTKIISSEAEPGKLCHHVFWNSDEPCGNCPMNHLSDEKNSKHSQEMFNHNFQVWVKATASWIDWIDGRRACLLDSVDITEYKCHMTHN